MTAEARSPTSYFQCIVQYVRAAQRHQNPKRLQAFIGSEKFATSLVSLPPAERMRALGIVSEVMGAPAPIQRQWKFPPPRRSIKWTELTKARFAKAFAAGGLAAGARAVGISYGAARMAARRQGLLAAATPQLKKAA